MVLLTQALVPWGWPSTQEKKATPLKLSILPPGPGLPRMPQIILQSHHLTRKKRRGRRRHLPRLPLMSRLTEGRTLGIMSSKENPRRKQTETRWVKIFLLPEVKQENILEKDRLLQMRREQPGILWELMTRVQILHLPEVMQTNILEHDELLQTRRQHEAFVPIRTMVIAKLIYNISTIR